jgi:hypothetical protein
MEDSPRIVVIKRSLVAFRCGLIGFIPILGLIPAICALLCWGGIYFRYRQEWNPASAYLDAGARMAVLGLLLSALLVCAKLIVTYYR